jgi:FixJ family two-component response regulator
VTLRVYEGIPLTQIAKEVGTSVRMIEQHYAGVIENWDGQRVPADDQIRAARRLVDPKWTLKPIGGKG